MGDHMDVEDQLQIAPLARVNGGRQDETAGDVPSVPVPVHRQSAKPRHFIALARHAQRADNPPLPFGNPAWVFGSAANAQCRG